LARPLIQTFLPVLYMSSQQLLPVLLVSGFLGSGKTTLMRRLILDAQARGLRVSVIVNEFGAADVDSHILREADAELIASIAGGCACCTGQDDLHQALLEIASRPPTERPDAILMEASGLADPILLLDVLTAAQLLKLLRPTALVSVVDSVRWNELASSLGPLLRRQIQLADWIVLNKTDLATPNQLTQIAERLTQLNDKAQLVRAEQAQFDLTPLWQQLQHQGTLQRPQSTLIDGEAATSSRHADSHTVVCPLPHPVERARLEAALQGLGPEVWRAKGFVRLRGESGLQLVQFTGSTSGGRYQIAPFYLTHGAMEPETSLVFLGAALDAAKLQQQFRGGTMLAFI
jgi:G3E family GTPase